MRQLGKPGKLVRISVGVNQHIDPAEVGARRHNYEKTHSQASGSANMNQATAVSRGRISVDGSAWVSRSLESAVGVS
jgi:hypothetical protein